MTFLHRREASPGPLEEAYLQREIHPDEKAQHTSSKDEQTHPKPDLAMPEEDLWMYT